jgi:hypothetical protein
MNFIIKNKKKVLIAAVILFAFGGWVLSYYYYAQNQSLRKTPDQIVQEQAIKVTAEVAKLMQLPTDETPSVVTITDKTKVADQPFFKNAENGDALLVYSKNMEAIIYRPSINKIIQVGPIYNQEPAVETTKPNTKSQDVPTVSTTTKKTK